jgi:hypothetical protein
MNSFLPSVPKKTGILYLILAYTALFGIMGCDKFTGDQTIPAYIQVDSLGFVSDNDVQGTDNQNIVDAWVYVDDDLIGGFEMPALIPVLKEGVHKLEIRPGIKLNGISDTRAPNPCFQPIIVSNFNLVPDSIVLANGVSTYYNNAEFVWIEDFEDASLSIFKSANSDTGIYRTQPAGAPQAYIDEHSEYSGICYLDKTNNYLELVSDDGNGQGFVFDRGDFIFLEINYTNNIPLEVGVYIKLNDNTVEDRSYLMVSASEAWNKIYVNFTPIVNETVNAVDFKIYFRGQLPLNDVSAFIILDNLKLVTRPNL